MSELLILKALLLVAFALAPIFTRTLWLERSVSYLRAHVAAFLATGVGVLFDIEILILSWILFCAFGFFLYLKKERAWLFSSLGVATCLPFVFSLISALWFTAGSFDLKLLGYNPAWSFYAALHGAFIGWMFLGGLVYLAKIRESRIFLPSVYFCFAGFLLIAFGIDGVPYIKRVGVVILSVILPMSIAIYCLRIWPRNRQAGGLAVISLLGLAISMALALLNEFWIAAPRMAFGLPLMVLSHGLLNALVVLPCFGFAVVLEARKRPLVAN